VNRFCLLSLVALLAGSCGGKAVIDDVSGTGGGGTSSSGGAGASGGTGGSQPVPIDICDECQEPPAALAELPPALTEISGLAASQTHPGYYWAHNDSGDQPRLFLLGPDGSLDGEYSLVGADAVDWEDIAVGPCDTTDGVGSCIYVGDIGDNDAVRDDYVIYRTLEPAERVPAGTLAVQAFGLSYPDGSHDAEAMFWADGALHIITKQLTTVSQVFRVPKLVTEDVVAEEVLAAFLPPEGILAVTAADANEQGVLVRTYTSLFFYPTIGLSLADALEAEPCGLPVAQEGQGESVAWRRDAVGYVTASEGAGERLNLSACQ
jgi:hypothetical protein